MNRNFDLDVTIDIDDALEAIPDRDILSYVESSLKSEILEEIGEEDVAEWLAEHDPQAALKRIADEEIVTYYEEYGLKEES